MGTQTLPTFRRKRRGMGDTALAPVSDPNSQNGSPILPPWIYPPPNFENIDKFTYTPIPALNVESVILTFVVPAGRNGIIYKVANNFVGAGWVEGSGDIVWRILVDGTPPPGATDYENILGSLGNPASPTQIPGFRIYENQKLTFEVFNNPAGAGGGVLPAGQLIGARFIGWDYPREYEDADIWI